MKLTIAGDALFSSRNLRQTMDPELVARLATADAKFINAEFVTPRPGTAPAAGRGYQTSVKPDTLAEFQDLDFRYVSFANNHTGDYGIEGLRDTVAEARSRSLHPLGVGETLAEARKPVFVDHADARIAILTVAVTRSEVFAAADPGNGVPGRPGVNPLRWHRRYLVSPADFAQLKAIDERIGTAASMRKGKEIETFIPDERLLDFGSLFEGALQFGTSETPGVETWANPKDQAAILKQIADAKERSDYVMVNIHTHEGENENWYADYAPQFIEEFAHLAVEAGAQLIVGHGAHFTRGVEAYKEGLILYNIGSLVMEFEAGESLISPEMFAAYGYEPDEVPSTLHKNRTKNAEGAWQGFYSDPMFSENLLVEVEVKRGVAPAVTLVPLDLQMTHEFVTKRGLPVMANAEQRASLLERLNRLSSERYATNVVDTPTGFQVKASQAKEEL